jgi:SAM-dependent methyltransferase
VSTLGDRLAREFPPPPSQWDAAYGVSHGRLLDAAFANEELLGSFAGGEDLPAHYGAGLDERVVEFPWLLSQGPFGRLLDAGSTLNHAHILDRFLPRADATTIVTLEPEAASYPERRVSYVYADLRELPFRDGWFDTVVCASTLEHVGMDNTLYDSPVERAEDPVEEQRAALRELARVCRPGGRILLTVPVGRLEDHTWFLQHDEPTLTRVLAARGWEAEATVVYRYSREGWRRSALRDVGDVEYRDFHADPTIPEDLAAAARAVACVRLAV